MAQPSEDKVQISLGPVLARGFAALRAGFSPYFLAGLIFAGLPIYLPTDIRFLRAIDTPSGGWWTFTVLVFIPYFGASLLQVFITRSAILVTSGRDPSYGASAFLALRLFPAMLGLFLISAVVVGLGLIFFIIPGLMAYCAFFVAVPAMVEERSGLFESIQRSFDLTRGARWNVFALAVLATILAVILSGIASALVAAAAAANLSLPVNPAGVAQGVAGTIGALFSAAMTAALYIELRTVKEGATEDALAAVFE